MELDGRSAYHWLDCMFKLLLVPKPVKPRRIIDDCLAGLANGPFYTQESLITNGLSVVSIQLGIYRANFMRTHKMIAATSKRYYNPKKLSLVVSIKLRVAEKKPVSCRIV